MVVWLKKKLQEFKVIIFDEFDDVDSTQSVIFEYLEEPYMIFIFISNKITSI